LKLLQLTDLHLRPAGRLAYGVVDSNEMVRRACVRIAELDSPIDAILMTGDLADCGLADEYAELRQCVDRLAPIPVYLIPGNHDRREALLAAFPTLPNAGGFIQYEVDSLPVRLLMLDSVVAGATHGELCRTRLAWLRETLAEQPDRETMLALHHPPFETGITQFDSTNLRNPDAFHQIVAAHPQITRIIAGHHHRFAIGNIAQAICIAAPSVAYPFMVMLDPAREEAFTQEPGAFLLHAWRAGRGFVTQELFTDHYPGPFPVPFEPDYPGRS